MTTIAIGGLGLRFLADKAGAEPSVTMFEMIVAPQARMPIAHYHEGWDETIYGLSNATTWRVAGEDRRVGPGEALFIPRRTVHGFRNDGPAAASCLCILTPGVLGSDYFAEMAALVAAGADPSAMKDVMLRHGLVPAPQG